MIDEESILFIILQVRQIDQDQDQPVERAPKLLKMPPHLVTTVSTLDTGQSAAILYRVIHLVEDNLLLTLLWELRFSSHCGGTFNLMSTICIPRTDGPPSRFAELGAGARAPLKCRRCQRRSQSLHPWRCPLRFRWRSCCFRGSSPSHCPLSSPAEGKWGKYGNAVVGLQGW